MDYELYALWAMVLGNSWMFLLYVGIAWRERL